MAFVMTTIPRRKIYETMLEFEDAVLEMEILTYNDDSFESNIEKFKQEKFPILIEKIIEIEALFVMFLNNEKFENEDEFNKVLKSHVKYKEKRRNILLNSEVLPERFKELLSLIDEITKDSKSLVPDRETTIKSLALLDEFNHIIPKILEIRRDEM